MSTQTLGVPAETVYGTAAVGPPADEGDADDQVVSHSHKVNVADLPALVMPWILFAVTILPPALVRGPLLSDLSLVLGIVLAVGFVLLSRGRAWQMLSVTCLVSVGLGQLMGYYDRTKYLNTYHLYSRSPTYANVLPSTHPGALRDAAFLDFSKDARVDASKGAGYQSGDLWCAAPIVGRTMPDRIGFWAVGTNCCKARGLFECGDVWNLTKHGALVVIDSSPLLFPEIPMYLKAAHVAATAYGLPLADQPIFVRWDANLDVALNSMWGDAMSFSATTLFLFLGVIPIVVLLLKLFGLALADPEGNAHWHPEQVDLMTFGIEFIPRHYSREFRLDMLQQRCYWSGEVLYDFAFHLANKHMFVGILFSHPAHPYTKWRRMMVCVLACLLIVFPVAAVSEKTGYTSVVRIFLIIIAAMVPRNLMKLYVIQLVRQASELRPDDARREGAQASVQTVFVEFGFFFTCVIFTLLVCATCTQSIKDSTGTALVSVLGKNVDGLGFAFILEPLADLVTPFFGHGELEGIWTLGFFGRWRMERDQLEVVKDYETNRGASKRRQRTFWASTEQEVLGWSPVPRSKHW